jgi:hypothetical protein
MIPYLCGIALPNHMQASAHWSGIWKPSVYAVFYNGDIRTEQDALGVSYFRSRTLWPLAALPPALVATVCLALNSGARADIPGPPLWANETGPRTGIRPFLEASYGTFSRNRREKIL